MSRRLIALFVAVILCAGRSARGSDERSQPKVLSLCELVTNWKAQSGHEVRVRAVYSEEVVQERLYDPSCPEAGEIAVKWPARLTKDMRTAVRKLHGLVARDSHKRAWVVLEGVFHGPEPFEEGAIPTNLPPSMKEQMRNSHKRYGYMSGFDNMIEVTKLDEATRVPASLPDFRTNSFKDAEGNAAAPTMH